MNLPWEGLAPASNGTVFNAGWTFIDAKGRITIPAGNEVEFEYSARHDSLIGADPFSGNHLDLKILQDFPTCAFQYLSAEGLEKHGLSVSEYLHAFEKQESLFGVSFVGCHFEIDDLAALSHHPTLRSLALIRSASAGPIFGGFKGHPGLKSILLKQSLRAESTTATQLLDLDSFTQLEYLTLGETGITDNDLKIIGRLTNLKGLVIPEGIGCTPEGLFSLKSLKSIEQLTLSSSWSLSFLPKSPAFELLSSLPALREIRLDCDLHSGEDVFALAALHDLKSLHLNAYLLPETGIDRFHDARPDVELYIRGKLLPRGEHLALPAQKE